jgi:hypothetical protein
MNVISDQITLILRDKSTPTLSYCEGEEEEEEIEKPVSKEDRHNTIQLKRSTTCEGDVERESTKQNTDKVVSCNSTATAERSQQQILFRASSDKSESIDSFKREYYQEQKCKDEYDWRCVKGDWIFDEFSFNNFPPNEISHDLPSLMFYNSTYTTCSVLFMFRVDSW